MTKEQLQAYLQALNEAVFVRGTGFTVTVDGETRVFSAGEMAAERKRVEQEIDALTPGLREAAAAVGGVFVRPEEERAAKQRREQLTAGQQAAASKQNQLIKTYIEAVGKIQSTAEEIAAGSYKTEKDLADWEKKAVAAEKALNKVGLFVAPDGSIVRQTGTRQGRQVTEVVSTGTAGTVQRNPVAGQFVPGVGMGQMPSRPPDETPSEGPGTGPSKTPTAATPAAPADANTWIDTQLQLRNLEDNKKNRAALRSEFKTAKTALPADWREKFAAKFPGLEYMLNENIFGPEVVAVIQRAVSERWFLYPETAAALIKREIANTPYGMNATQKQESFDAKSGADQMAAVQKRAADLQKSYGMLGLSTAEWQQLAYVAERNGEDDLLTQQRLFQTIYERTPEGARKYETAVRMVENGRLGQEVNKEFGRYLLKAPDEAIEMYATGQTTLENIRQQSRAAAKFMFPALADLIDQGVDVKFVADQYAATAADILEQAPGTIDMMDPRYRVALDVRDGANNRTMSLGEWQTLLKTDPNYGWQYTKQANQQSMDIATTIARVFGKVQ